MFNRKLPLTKREEQVLDYIIGFVVDNGYSPTRQEIATHFEMTPAGAQKFVRALHTKGKIVIYQRKGERIARNIILIDRKLTN